MKKINLAACVILVSLLYVSVVSADDSVPTEHLIIRNNGTIIYDGMFPLPAAGTISVNDATSTPHEVNADSVLGVLYALDETSDSFSLSSLSYYASFNSFYLKCITGSDGQALCDSWQYVVDNTAPSAGIDSTILTGGEIIGIYFGTPHSVVLNKTSVAANDSFIASAKKYNYLDNSWTALNGVTIGVTTPNPSDPYNPTVVVSQTVDGNGDTTITLPQTGSYSVGIVEDYFFPSYPITVTPPTPKGDGASTTVSTPFNVPKAVAFLASVEAADGTFGGNDMYTDWAIIGLSSTEIPDTLKEKIKHFLDTTVMPSTFLTDIERRSISLLALGENPYSFNGTNYIQKITDSFDGAQFGDATIVTDDIFALIPLQSAGYTLNDTLIEKDIAFILSNQKTDGSWEESIDLTAAAIMSLTPYSADPTITTALTKASQYLQEQQAADGGFKSLYSSSWAAQAMSALSETWTKNGHTISDYFAEQQVSDGAVLPTTETAENRIWATSYAIPAVLGRPWSVIMHNVSKPLPSASVFLRQEPLVLGNVDPSQQVVTLPKATRPIITIEASTVPQSIVPPPSAESTSLPEPASVRQSGTTIPLVIAIIAGASLLGFTVLKKFKVF